MLIRTRMAVSVDGFVATPDGRPAILAMPDFSPSTSYGFPGFLEQIEAVAMGRTTFEPALAAERWPWPGRRVFVMTSRPLPPETPSDVIVVSGGPAALLEELRAARLAGDVHLVGGPRTIQSVLALGAIDRLGILAVPIVFGDGLPLSHPGRHCAGFASSATSRSPTGPSTSNTPQRDVRRRGAARSPPPA